EAALAGDHHSNGPIVTSERQDADRCKVEQQLNNGVGGPRDVIIGESGVNPTSRRAPNSTNSATTTTSRSKAAMRKVDETHHRRLGVPAAEKAATSHRQASRKKQQSK
ncbi:unnamed protein product, partial [Amoebophrya sp. A120]